MDLLTLAQAGERLGLSASTLRTQVKRGRLKATLYGKTWLVTDAEVERYRAENLGNIGRPPVPHIFTTLGWPNGAYGTKTLLLAQQGDIGGQARATMGHVAEKAIAEGACQLVEVTSKLQADSRLRSVLLFQDESVPMILSRLRDE